MEYKGTVILKPPTTFDEQLKILEQRGLIVHDKEVAIKVLSRVNYYRFSAYTLTFKTNDKFNSNVSFTTIYQHYEFDRRLRILLLEIIEPIEIAFRTHIAYLIATKYGAEEHRNPKIFSDIKKHSSFLRELDACVDKSRKDLFIKHHIDKYGNHFPVWVALEAVTLGVISKLFTILKTQDKKSIVRDHYPPFTHYQEVENWLLCITVLRNRCAHYSRLFNEAFLMPPKFQTHINYLTRKNRSLLASLSV